MWHLIRSLFSLIGFIVTAGAALVAFGMAREYVRSRLRFVDAVRHPLAPWVTWFGATLILLPVVAILPIVTAGTALIVGAAAGLGTSSGVKALKRGD